MYAIKDNVEILKLLVVRGKYIVDATFLISIVCIQPCPIFL